MEQYWWKRGKRELCLVHVDEYGTQYLFFYVTGNKKFRLRFILDYNKHDRLKYVKTLGMYIIKEEEGWKLLGEDDDVLG
jgi:hypothetical protein